MATPLRKTMGIREFLLDGTILLSIGLVVAIIPFPYW